MGKSMQDLLNEFKFQDKQFNPRNVKADMLSPLPDDKFQNDIKQINNLVKNSGDIYGKDIVRITTQGKVDTKKVTKAALKVTGNLIQSGLGLFGKIGKAAGSAINDTLNTTQHPLLPSDLVVGNNVTDSGLYAKLAAGNINNQKTAVGNFLSGVATPQQFKQNIGPAVVSAASSIVLKGLGKLASKLSIASAASNLGKNSPLNIGGIAGVYGLDPKFPSTQINVQDILKEKKGIATNQQQLVRNAGFIDNYEGSNIPNNIEVNGSKIPSTGVNPTDYLNSYKEEVTTFSTGSVGEMQEYSNLGFNSNDNINIGLRRQSFTDGLKNPYKLQDAKRTTQGAKLDGFLIVKDGVDGIYKVTDIVKEGKPIRFSDRASIFGLPNVSFFSGYSNRKADDINKILGDHRLKSLNALKDIDSDLIKVRFGIDGKFIYLLSNITGFTDTPTPTWGEAKAVGSPYKFYFYESFEREVSFKTQIYASSQEELSIVWEKANNIMKLTNGKSAGVLGIKGKVCSLRIGDMFDSNNGFITNCTLTVPDISPWEIKNGSQYPFVCELDITYKVIQTVSDSNFYGINGSKKIMSPNYDYLEFPSTALLPPPNNFNKVSKPSEPTIDLVKLKKTPLSKFEPLNSEKINGFKQEIQTESDVEAMAMNQVNEMTGNAIKNNKIITNPTNNLSLNTNNVSVPPQNFGKQPEYDPILGDYKKNIFGQVKLFKVRGVDNNPN
jgi:hypothetical protein